MKKEFFDNTIELMKSNENIYFISCGLGWPRTNELKQFEDRYVQAEASEQTALDIAVGLAYSGKTPFVYTITPFFYRGFETLRTYVNHENLHILLIGAGRTDDYSEMDGFSHDATDIGDILRPLKNIVQHFPGTKEEIPAILNRMIEVEKPHFLSLKR